MNSVFEFHDEENWQGKCAPSGSIKKKLLKIICQSSSISISLLLIGIIPSK